MRTSRLLARRIALYETLLQSATSDGERRRIAAALRQVRGLVKQHRQAQEPPAAIDEPEPHFVRLRTRSRRKRGVA